MKFYERDNMLYFIREGEWGRLSACGKDSIRFQTSPGGEISELDYTLMPQKMTARIIVEKKSAAVTNGNMTARLYDNGRVEFYFKDKLILREKSELAFDAGIRNYRNNASGLYRARRFVVCHAEIDQFIAFVKKGAEVINVF